jgi:hypothetical protein
MKAMTESMAVQTTKAMPARSDAGTVLKTSIGRTLHGVQSSPIQAKDYATKQRDKWLNKLAKEFLMLDGLFPFKELLPKENCPEWVHRVELEYLAAVHPGAMLKGGHRRVIWVSMCLCGLDDGMFGCKDRRCDAAPRKIQGF